MPGRANNEPILSLFHVEFLSLYCTPRSPPSAKIYRRHPAFRHADVDSKSFRQFTGNSTKIEPRLSFEFPASFINMEIELLLITRRRRRGRGIELSSLRFCHARSGVQGGREKTRFRGSGWIDLNNWRALASVLIKQSSKWPKQFIRENVVRSWNELWDEILPPPPLFAIFYNWGNKRLVVRVMISLQNGCEEFRSVIYAYYIV